VGEFLRRLQRGLRTWIDEARPSSYSGTMELNPEHLRERLAKLDMAVRSGEIMHATDEELLDGLLAACDQQTGNQHLAKEINKGFLLASLLMERRGEKSLRLGIALAFAAVVLAAVQIVIALAQFCR
jgi:hypothetical protein